MQEKSKVKLNYELPDEVVEDYTYEMGRLKFKVNKFRLHLFNPFCLSSQAKILINSNKGRFSNGKTCQSNRSIHTLSGESVSNGRSGFRSKQSVFSWVFAECISVLNAQWRIYGVFNLQSFLAFGTRRGHISLALGHKRASEMSFVIYWHQRGSAFLAEPDGLINVINCAMTPSFILRNL